MLMAGAVGEYFQLVVHARRLKDTYFSARWSDIFYLPRRFFKDFVFLADVFATAAVPPETATTRIGSIQPCL